MHACTHTRSACVFPPAPANGLAEGHKQTNTASHEGKQHLPSAPHTFYPITVATKSTSQTRRDACTRSGLERLAFKRSSKKGEGTRKHEQDVYSVGEREEEMERGGVCASARVCVCVALIGFFNASQSDVRLALTAGQSEESAGSVAAAQHNDSRHRLQCQQVASMEPQGHTSPRKLGAGSTLKMLIKIKR